MAMTMVSAGSVTGGVDTHLDVHVAAALDHIGGLLGVAEFDTTRAGYEALLVWLLSFGVVERVGVEGTSSYGTGLSRFLMDHEIEVIEVDRPNRQERSRRGKSDPIDAVEAARAALSGRATGLAKSKDGPVEAIRALLVARRSARNHRISSLVQMRHLVFTAPRTILRAVQDPAGQPSRSAASSRHQRRGHLCHQGGAQAPGAAGATPRCSDQTAPHHAA